MKPKILFLSTQLPYPPISGGVIKSWKLIERLSQHFEIYLVCPLKGEDPAYLEEFKKKLPISDLFCLPLDIPRNAKNLIKSYLKGQTLNMFRNYDDRIQKKVLEWIPQVDAIVVDHYEMYSYIPKNGAKPVILHQHNAEFILWERLAQLAPWGIKKALIYAESRRIKKAEKRFSEHARQIWAAPNDIEALQKLGIPTQKMRVTYHLGDDSPLDKPLIDFNKAEKALFYMGTLSWEANIDGLVWFFEQCWGLIKKQVPEVKLYVLGKNPDPRLIQASKKDPSVIFTGFITDPEEYFIKCMAAIAPLRFGSGTKVKVLTYLYRGIPVITSPIGVEGLILESGKHAFITDQAQVFSESCIELLKNPEKCLQMGLEGKEIAVKKYSWDKVLSDHVQSLNELISFG